MIRPISRHRFDIFTLAKDPRARLFARELAWFEDDSARLLGTMFVDLTDGDFAFVVMGRDEHSVFRWIAGESCFADPESAVKALHISMDNALRKGYGTSPADAARKKQTLVAPAVAPDRLHPYFRVLIENDAYSSAKEAIKEIAFIHDDLDGNYVEQFQTTAFDARLWELYLRVFLHESGFALDRTHATPDFLAEKAGVLIGIEAVTANPTQGVTQPMPPDDVAARRDFIQNYVPIKLGSALYSKLQHKYWELPHLNGLPFVLAIHDFHQPGSMMWSQSGLECYLYGYRHDWTKSEDGTLEVIPAKIDSHRWGTKEIPSGFFSLPGADNVSAVLTSSSATISKFARMGKLAGLGDPRVRIARRGLRYTHDPNAVEPTPFVAEVKPGIYDESWGEGAALIHNPYARLPIDPALFPDIAHLHFDNGQVISTVPPFHPFSSMTILQLE